MTELIGNILSDFLDGVKGEPNSSMFRPNAGGDPRGL
jgi:hypothetical protein